MGIGASEGLEHIGARLQGSQGGEGVGKALLKFGLQAGIFTRDLFQMLKAWDVLDVGGVVINDVPSYRVDNMPYGGVKDSGLGREGVRFAMDDMTEIRNLVIRRRPQDM